MSDSDSETAENNAPESDEAESKSEKLPAEWVSRDEVQPNDWNPNEMPSNKRRELRKSIQNTGWTNPIVVRPAEDSESEHEIIDGEQRLIVAGHDKISDDESLTPEDVPAGHVPVYVISVEETQAQVATLQHNRSRGHLDYNEFGDLLRDLEDGELQETKDTLSSMDSDVIDMIRDGTTALERFGQEDEYEDTWRPTPAHEVGGLETESASDSVTFHSTGDDPGDDDLSSSGSSGEGTLSTHRIVCVMGEDDHRYVVNTLGFDNGASRLVDLLDGIYADEELYDAFIGSFDTDGESSDGRPSVQS